MKQYKNDSGLCLLEIQHHFSIMNPGDIVLDIGCGQHYGWTDLALKLAQNPEQSHFVLSNDLLPLKKQRNNNIYISGDFNSEPVQTEIALQMEEKNFDVILCDVSPEYTGNVHVDARGIVDTTSSIVGFGQKFLKKGGNMVLKFYESDSEPLMNELLDIFFHKKQKFVPTTVRKDSPVFFYVMKGFLMSEHYTALELFFKKYRGTAENRRRVVRQFEGKYVWDPIKVIKRYVLDEVIRMRREGRTDKDIIKVFEKDPYSQPQKVIKMLNQAQEAKKNRNQVEQMRIINKLTQGQIYQHSVNQIGTKQQLYQFCINKLQQQLADLKGKNSKITSMKPSRAPLQEGQVYMKTENKEETKKFQKNYLPSDAQGKYSKQVAADEIDKQIQKIQIAFPEIKEMIDDLYKNSDGEELKKSKRTIDDILKMAEARKQKINKEQLIKIHEDYLDSLRNMSQETKEEMQKVQREYEKDHFNEDRTKKEDRFVNQRRSRRVKKDVY